MKYSAIIGFLFLYAGYADAQDFEVERLNDARPIITEKMFVDLGAGIRERENINGPSLIRIPDWIPPEARADSSAEYYMYFAHHDGDYIRMAWAPDIEGPWNLFRTGSNYKTGERGVLDLGEEDYIYIGKALTIIGHVASPDVIVDDSNKLIIMYFHSMVRQIGYKQRSFVSTSADGLSFREGIKPVMLGGHYFRVFEYKDSIYALANRGNLFLGGSRDSPWSAPAGFNYHESLWTQREENPFKTDIEKAGFEGAIRHVDIHREEDTLFVFYSRIGDSPERIQYSAIRLDGRSSMEWDPGYPPLEVLRPAEIWEGATLPELASASGVAPEKVHELRDPDIFRDRDGQLYLLYTGMGEDAIGLAKLDRRYGHPVGVDKKLTDSRPELLIRQEYANYMVWFEVSVPGAQTCCIRIYSITGSLQAELNGEMPSNGKILLSWSAEGLQPGIYIARLEAGSDFFTGKFIQSTR